MTTIIKFKLPAEYVAHATGGVVLGEFNNWNPANALELRKNEDGSLYAEIALSAGRSYEYRYLLNDGSWVNDNTSKAWSEVNGTVVENCIVHVPTTGIKEKKPRVKKVQASKVVAPADELTKIKGLTKKIALAFKKAGITTFKDLSKLTLRNSKAILDAAGIKVNQQLPASFQQQARLAAAGKWEELNLLASPAKTPK